ncbi:Myosin light chain kinase, smooth muscle [Pseudolycoriella hygida]|uniref:Myosin light chain kinase, smooth muscle n=1 Tax=Pseudolycoriella hygida TaxID=35572 RepID=A0A9Q0N5W0_9DIPT|nr:Myosin light chain kinase, smooth muscle [Pseudolycoriella hygida]
MNRGGSIKHGNVETLPIFTRPLKDLRCCDGDSITLECHVEAQPEPTVIWEKDGRILPHSSDFRANFCDDRATLSINRVFPEDEGEYTCIASNNIGKSYTSACIIVDVPEEKENLISRILTRPSGLLSTNSTPRSTPRTTPVRSISPMPLSYRSTHIDLSSKQHKCAAPKFYAMPHNRLAEEGETVRFQCAIAGLPTPWSTWDKDGLIVTPTTRINIKERDDLRILEIEEVTMEDAGLYRITLENDYGRIEATARLDVISNKRSTGRGIRTSASPRRSISSSRRIMGNSTQIGGRLALACNFRGGSVPNKKFYHNGNELHPTDRVKVIENDETSCLIIDNVETCDEGVYTCIANNESGIAATSTIVTFNDTQEHIAPEFMRGLGKTIHAKESFALDLVCSVVCSDPFDVVWSRDGLVIQDSDDFRYIDHGEGLICLRILDPFVFDSGTYTCSVQSDYGKCETSCEVHISEVSQQDELEMKPVFIKSPQAVVAAYGSVVSFCARVSPVYAKVRWSICGRNVTEDTRGILVEHQPDGVHILHVLGLEYNHSGEIKCVAYIPTHPDSIDSTETSVFTDLVVLPTTSPAVTLETNPSEQPELPAYIVRGPEDCSVTVGGTVTLEALFGGYSQPTVKWYRAGRQITESTNIKIKTTSGYSSLLLTDITADQSGKYTIEIMNEHSCDISSASVSVEGPPDPPGGRPSISQGCDRLSVAWCGPPFDGGVMITGFILEIQEENNDWIEYSTVVDSLATTIKGLKPGVAYKFRVRAENVHGRSAPSAESEEVRIGLGNEAQTVFDDDVVVRPGGDFKEKFTLQEELGKGRFGVVHRVIEKESGRVLAAKIVKCIKAVDKQKIQEEISIMQSLRHPKLLQLAAAFENPREMIMVMEYITGGELFERVVADDFTLTERDCILFIRQICEGVDYMHNKSVVHLDLKPENIMCHNRTSHQIKIIDFGLAQRISADTPVRVLFGTPEFIPPEIINYEPIGFQSDMWSIGVICYVLLSGLSPFMGESDVDTFSNITCADFDFDDDSFDAVSQDAKDFISSLLVHRKEKRLTAKQCLESKWLSDRNAKLSTAKICTDKLKKFVIRRKWQKTGNAIRALGRMATLSANSRRNSAASAAVPISPRPSITGTMTTTAIQHMSSLNEEEDRSTELLQANISDSNSESKTKNKTCNERSDSGFSECSNCSEKMPCICSQQTIDKNLVITEEKCLNDEDGVHADRKLSHDLLQIKLEEIADTQIDDDQATTDSSTSIASINTSSTSQNGSHTQETKRSQCFNDIKISVTSDTPTKPNLSRSSSVDIGTSPVDKGPIMRSDFTNTINMRKQWLEQNAHKEKQAVGPVTRTLIEATGKVSKLKQRFSLEKLETANSNGKTVSTFERSNPSSMTAASNKRALDRLSNSLTDHSDFTKSNINLDERNSYAKSIEARSPLRLDGRVKEASDRLTASSASAIKRNGGISPNSKNNDSFKKAAAFWKR